MSGKIAALVLLGTLLGTGGAAAQEVAPSPGLVEVAYMPVGAAYVPAKGDAPSFGNYGFGTAVAFNLNSLIGVEGELASMLATSSDLQFGDLDQHTKAPNMLGYSANVVVSPFGGRSIVPYATGGVGGLTMFERPGVGVTEDTTFLTGNVGGGIKWYASNRRWGLRGDYRFAATKSKDSAPEFFGRETRYLHRVYAAVVINTVR